MLVDSSAWIEFLRGTGSPAHKRLAAVVESEEPLATTGIVMLEILAGARDAEDEELLIKLLGRCALLALEEPSDFELAAALYRTCRREGVTIRQLHDCLIAAVAIRTGTPLLHADADFEALSRHTALETVEV